MESTAVGSPAYDAHRSWLTAAERSARLLPGAGATAGSAAEVQTAFTSFVGQTFFGQLLRAMRTSLGKPAYFHGGQAEEIFRSQLDQVLAEKMTAQSAEQFAQPMFARQFPQLAESLGNQNPGQKVPTSLADLEALKQR